MLAGVILSEKVPAIKDASDRMRYHVGSQTTKTYNPLSCEASFPLSLWALV